MKYLWTKNYHFRIGSLFFSEDFIFPIAWSGCWKKDFIVPIWQQDQLQGMVYNEDRPGAWDLFCDFDEFIITYSREAGDYTLSAEQLWLAFVMHEKFSKKWTNGEWELCVISS